MTYREKAKEQLGMCESKASGRLKKEIMFMLVKKAGLDNCYHCGEKIETKRELSIEHKIPWLHSDDPVGLYFDLDNIAFSHLSCNCSNSRSNSLRYRTWLREKEEGIVKSTKSG